MLMFNVDFSPILSYKLYNLAYDNSQEEEEEIMSWSICRVTFIMQFG